MNDTPFTAEAKKDFLSTLSHELRNPLAVIMSSAELLQLENKQTPEAHQLIQTIITTIRSITHTLSGLLDATTDTEATPFTTTIAAPNKKTHTILVVDDNELAARALGKLLERSGHQVTLAYSGTEALEKALHLKPEVIILDIGLPDMSGYAVAEQLQKQEGFSSILIALTGYGQTQDKERAFKEGFQLHFTKPVAAQEIEGAFNAISN